MKLLLAGLSLLFIILPTQAMEIVRERIPQATIVVSRDADEQIRSAAMTLQSYIQKSTGAQLPLSYEPVTGTAIHVGQTPVVIQWKQKTKPGIEALDQEGFILQGIDNKNFVIAGGSAWGVEFGVYDFLERYVGVRWLMPTELGIDIPHHVTLNVPSTRVVRNPVYLSRQLSPMNNLAADTSMALWARFNRARGRIAFHHNLVRLFPVSQFGKTHPEFYPMIKGKRYIPVSDDDENWQPNLSAPGIVDAAVGQIEKYFEKNPEATSYSLGMNDSDDWDESEASKAKRSGRKNYVGVDDVSDEYFAWANAVVEKVLLKYPDKWFGTLAYNGIAEPPTRVGVHPRIVPFITYDRMRWEDPRLREFGQQLTKRWEKVSPTLGWYDYAYGHCYLTPRIYNHRMQDYLSWGVKHKVQFHYAELYPNWGEGPKPWIFSKLQWNPNQDVDGLLTDWYTHFAGAPAAPHLRAYYDIWEKFWTVDIYRSKWNRLGGQYLPFNAEPTYLLDVPQGYISQSDQCLEEAYRLADTPQRKERVAKVQQMWKFYRASILTYQGMQAAAVAELNSESEALAFLEKVSDVTKHHSIRQKLLSAFKADPVFENTADDIFRIPTATGKNWGSSLLWRLRPWAEKSELIKARLGGLATSSSALKEQAVLILASANGKTTLVTRNPSFEEGLSYWNVWDKSDESPAYPKGTFKRVENISHNGSYSLHIQGLGRGAPMQDIKYQSGTYFATVNSYVPPGSHTGTATLTVHVADSKNVVLGGQFLMPTANIALPPGVWSNTVIPFVLPPADNRSASVRLLVTLDGFGADGQIYLDDVAIYRIEP